MSRYFLHLRDFEKAMGGLTVAMDGMHLEHANLKKQFRTYLADHESFAKNVRRYLDELEIDDDAPEHSDASTVARGQNDNDRSNQRNVKAGGK